MAATVNCPQCQYAFKPHSYRKTLTGVANEATTGAWIGSGMGIALGLLGAMAGTIPGAIIGGVIGALTSRQGALCPACRKIFPL